MGAPAAGAAFSVAAWPVEHADFFRHFRIYQTGPNSYGGNHYLMCTGIELYGVLRGEEEEEEDD